MKKDKVLRIVGLLVLLCGGITWAQVTTGTISGTVKDSTGLALPGATVVVLNADTGIARTAKTDADGRFSAPSLSLGNYRVTGSHEGFQTEVRSGIELTVGREAIVDLSLAVGTVDQSVEVKGEAPLLESTTSSLGSLVDDRTIRALPLNGRSYDQLALLQPGVILSSPGQTAGAPYNYGTGKRFSVGGQRPSSNSFLLDGTNINDQANGTPGGAAGTNLGVDTILEFKIFTNSYKAEYGHSNGAVVSAITRSGTNTLHGTAFEYIRNSALDARNYFDVGDSPPPFRRNQFGGVLGGPIKKEKTFFFGGYEGLRQGLGTTQVATVPTVLARQGILPTAPGSSTTITVPVNPIVQPFLNLWPLPNGRDFGDGSAQFLSSPTVVTNEDNFMVRVDHQLNAKTGIFGRYSFDTDSLNNPQSLPNLLLREVSRRQYVTLQANSVLNPKAFNNFRFAFNRTHSVYGQSVTPDPGPQLSFVPGQPIGGIALGSVGGSGTSVLTPLGPSQGSGASQWAFNIFQWSDDFSYVTGKHSLKAGVDIQRMRDNQVFPNVLKGAYTFTTFRTLLAGTPSNLQVSSPLGVLPDWGLRQTLYAVYGQDDYTVNSRLTLNVGLRWEMTTNPSDVNGKSSFLPSPSATAMVVSDSFFSISKKNFEPRLGLAWQLNASGKTVLRAGGGIYHNQILPYAFFSLTAVPPFFGKFSASNPPFPSGYQLFSGLSPGASTGLVALSIMAPAVKVPVNDQYNLSIQQQIFRNTVVQVAYAGNKANHLETKREADTPIPTICPAAPCPASLPAGTKYFPAGAPRRNPAWAGIRYSDFNGNSDYNSVTVTLRRQSPTGFQGQIFYTFSKAMDQSTNVSSAESVRSPSAFLDPENPGRDWGLSDFDSRHAVVASFSYLLPLRAGSKVLGALVNGWTLDGIGTFSSGMPFTPQLSAAVSRDLSTQFVERPNLVPGANQNPISGTSAGCPGFPAGTPVGNAKNWYDPCAFSLPVAGTYGNLGRNTVTGPGVEDVDFALEKIFKPSEKTNLTFRAEVFNILNHTNLGLPNVTALATSGAANPSAGVITYTTTSSRQLQFALRISF